jgi:hypothetical protein
MQAQEAISWVSWQPAARRVVRVALQMFDLVDDVQSLHSKTTKYLT